MKINNTYLVWNHEDEQLIVADPVRGAAEYSIYNKYEIIDEMFNSINYNSLQDFEGTDNLYLYTEFARLGKNSFIHHDGIQHLDELGLREDAVKLTDEFFEV